MPKSENLYLVLVLSVFAFSAYWGVAASVFEWRNPKANRMTLLRELPSVVTFQKLARYQ